MDLLEALTIIIMAPIVGITLLVLVSIARQITLAGGQGTNAFTDIAQRFQRKQTQP